MWTRPFVAWCVAILAVVVLGTHIQFFAQRVHLMALPAGAWLVALASALVLPSWGEIAKWRMSMNIYRARQPRSGK